MPPDLSWNCSLVLRWSFENNADCNLNRPGQGFTMASVRILLVEDEPRMANVIAKGLREQSYAVDVAQDGAAGLYQASINDYDVIILDVLLPQRDGYEVCRELRKRGNATPVLMLTARAAIDDRLTGFDAGADD